MKWSHPVGVLVLLIAGCEPMAANWQLAESLELGVPAEVGPSKQQVAQPVEDNRFPSDEEIEQKNDPLGEQDLEPAQPEEPTEIEPEEAEIAEPVPAVEEKGSADAPSSTADEQVAESKKEEPLPAPSESRVIGRGTDRLGSPSWGVRLVASIPEAQPPRAVLGLPSGEEVVVSPGSMIPEAAVVVIAVGPGTVVLAEITPEGDHAKVEQRTLHAQYTMGVPAAE